MKARLLKSLAALFACAAAFPAYAQVDIAPPETVLDAAFSQNDERNFRTPPRVFYPETWFHFIGGNVSSEGITADLKAISEAGFSGIQWFHGHFGGPWPGTGKQITALTPEWEKAVEHMGRTAGDLGLRLTVQTCPGWAMAGGPWIKPSQAMRDIVWSRTDVDAAKDVSVQLPLPQPSGEEWRDYRDVCVLAFPTPEGDTEQPLVPQTVEGGEGIDWQACLNPETPKEIGLAGGKSHTVSFTLPKGSVIRTVQFPSILSVAGHYVYKPGIHVLLIAETENGTAKTLVDTDFPMSNWQDLSDFFLACNEADGATKYKMTITPEHGITLRFVRFLSAARKNNWRAEAGWTLTAKESGQENPVQSAAAYIDPAKIVDVTQAMSSDGRLEWKAPAKGRWTVLRVGNVNKGWRNSPAPPEATGWECNKLDRCGADAQFENYVGMLASGPLAGGRASGMLMDSWECSTQTWTEGLENIFRASAGYELRKWLPAVMGYVIGSQETTGRFLLDWRRCLAKLYNSEFFARMTELAHNRGLKVQYETAGGDILPIDIMEYYKHADVPMCEFWQPFSDGYVGDLNFKPVKPTASAANVYGKRRVAAESFTSFELTWDEHLQMLKEVANFNMVEGVTHCVFHTYTHNPQMSFLPPGTSFGSNIGTPFLRGQTWWKHMPLFTGYLARTGYMLERGRPVRQILWYLGDEISHKPDQFAPFPEGFKYDYCNPDVLLNRLSVEQGKIVIPERISYDMLWIPENRRMLPSTLEKLRSLIAAGAKVVASAPSSPAMLSASPAKTEKQFRKLVKSLWKNASAGDVVSIGSGSLAVGMGIDEAIKAFGLQPDVKIADGSVQWLHRRADGAEWYFVTAPRFGEFHGEVAFRSKGCPEIWDATTGEIYAADYRSEGEYTVVRLDLCRAENCFVVFHDVQSGLPLRKRVTGGSRKIVVSGPWTVRFSKGWGAPDSITVSGLQPVKDMNLGSEGRAYSGTVGYEAVFDMPDSEIPESVILNLGKADMVATVKVNGKECGALWAEPYRLDIGQAVKKGCNRIEVEVTTTWHNRLVYDAGLPEEQRKTWVIGGPGKDTPLRDSGLLGPVSVEM